MSSRSKLIRGHVFKVRVYWLSSFKVRIDWWSCLQVQNSQIASLNAGRLGCRNWLCWLGPYSPESGPGVYPLHPVACMLQGRPCFQGHCYLEVISSRSKLIRGHVLKVRVYSRSGLIGGYVFKVRTLSVACTAVRILGGEDAGTGCAGWGLTALTQDLLSTLSIQWPTCYKGGHVFKVIVIWKSCLQGQS